MIYNIKFPNRDATFLRNGFVLSQLDGEGMRQMEKQQEMASKESYKEHLLKEIAKNTGANIHDLRNNSHQEMRTERTTNAVYFDMSHGDDMDVTQTNEEGVQTQSNTNESDAQTQTQTTESGAQTMRPRLTKSAGTQSEPRVNTKGTQATEDRSEEIEKIKRASELEKEALREQHNNNIERVRQQVRAEIESAHERERQEYQQEAMEKANITEAESQRRIQQIQQTAQQRAQESVRQTAAANAAAKAEAKAAKAAAKAANAAIAAKEKAENEAKAAQEQANESKRKEIAARKSEHNTEHKSERSPDTRAKAKQKADGSPTPLKTVPPYPTGERASGSKDNPESTHEPKGDPGRPSNTQPKAKAKRGRPTNAIPRPTADAKPKAKAKPKANPKPNANPTTTTNIPVRKEHVKPQPKAKANPAPENNNPRHDTETDLSTNKQHWREQTIGFMRDQLTKRGFRETRMPDNKPIRRPDYLREILRRIDAGTWA